MEEGPSERTQERSPKLFNHGIYLPGEPLEKVSTFQTHVVRLDMETDTWATRCRLVHPGGTTGSSSRKAVSDEYTATLERTKRKHLPIMKMVYMGLPTQRRKVLMRQWEVAFPTPKKDPLDAWITGTQRSVKPTQQERRAKRKDAETALKTDTLTAKPTPLRALRI